MGNCVYGECGLGLGLVKPRQQCKRRMTILSFRQNNKDR